MNSEAIPVTLAGDGSQIAALATAPHAQASRNQGAAALRIVADEDSGEVEEAEILASFGRLPEDLLESIKGG